MIKPIRTQFKFTHRLICTPEYIIHTPEYIYTRVFLSHELVTNTRTSKIQASYKLEGTVLENVESIKYLGVTITKDLKWNTHISNVCTKANRTLVFFLDEICFLAPKM